MAAAGPSTSSYSNTQDGVKAAKQLVQRVSRAFYSPSHSIIIDQLVRKDAMSQEDLVGRVGMQAKELTKLTHRLVEDQILAVHRRLELREHQQKATQKNYYYMDYSHATDVIKWRMFKIQAHIDHKLRNELEQQGYVCPKCGKRFTTYDAAALVDFSRGNGLYCDVCSTEVKDNENEEEVKGNKDRTKRLMEQTATIRGLLKGIEDVILPSFDVVRWLELNGPAGVAATGDAASGPGVQIQLAGDDDEELMKAKREADAAEKRSQNQLPSWIAQSTVSGEKTSVQLERDSRVVASTSQLASTSDIKPSPSKLASSFSLQSDDAVEGSGGDVGIESFYASLTAKAEEEEEPSGSGSPSPFIVKKEEGASDEELGTPFDGTASRGSVDEAQRNGKRSRDDTDFVREDSASSKRSRVDSVATPLEDPGSVPADNGTGSASPEDGGSAFNSPVPAMGTPQQEEDDDDEFEFEEEGGDPNTLIQVGEKMIPFSEINDALLAEMTADEYQMYFDVYQRVGGND